MIDLLNKTLFIKTSAVTLLFLQLLSCSVLAGNKESITLQLQWKYQFQFAGFIMAKELGYYNDLGLDVNIKEYDNQDNIQDLLDHKVDYVISNTIIAYKNKKLQNVSLLATYFQRSPLIIVTQPEIRSILDLSGKRVMMSHDNIHNSSLAILLEYYNLNQKNTHFVEPSYNLDDFINKKVDATTLFRSNELFELNQRNIPHKIIDPIEYGFPTAAINLFTSQEKVKSQPQQIKKFLQASKKGWQYALAHIDEVATLIHEKYRPEISLEQLQYEGIVTKELMLTNLYDIGQVNEDFVYKAYKQLIQSGRIDKDQTQYNFIFNSNKESAIRDENTPTIKLTRQELQWLEQNSEISYTGDPNWLPFEAFENNGRYVGIVADHLDLIEQRLPIKFNKIVSSSWSDAINIAMEDRARIISGDSADKILNKNFNPVDSYINSPIVIVMSSNNNIKNSYVNKLEELSDQKIAIIKDYGYTTDIYNKYPHMSFIEVDNIQEALIGVETGKYDAMLASLALVSYTIEKMGFERLIIVGKTDVVMEVTLFVNKNQPLLHSIINKAVHSIDAKTQQNIVSKWRHSKTLVQIDYSYLWQVLLLVSIIILLLFYRQYRLKKHHEKTAKGY